jgi:hypothetical protein
MSTEIDTTEAKAFAVRMFFIHGANAVPIIRARLAAARQDGDAAKAARWEAVLAAIEGPADAAPDARGAVDAMLACWRRLRDRRPLRLAA